MTQLQNSNGEGDLLGRVDAATLLALPEYGERYDAYNPASGVVEQLAAAATAFSVVAAVASWCGDSRREVPRFLRVVDELRQLGIDVTVEMTACSRSKSDPAPFISTFDIERVPTFIVFRDGVEAGRVVERPIARIEHDLLQILQRPR